MSGKSRHGRGKGSLQSKKKRNIRRSNQVVVARPQTVANPQTVTRSDEKTAVFPEVMASPSGMAITAQDVYSYPNLPYELRRVGILAGIILAVLILLVLLLG
jgi:hypothetical protein